MSSLDYNNGLIVGLALRGLPYKATGEDFVQSIVNISNTQTLITFTTDIQDFVSDDNIYSFYVMAKFYWTMETYPILSIVKTTSNQILLTHTDFSDCDGIITIGYDAKTGTIKTYSGVRLGSFFYSFAGVFTLLKIRIRESIPANRMLLPQLWALINLQPLSEAPVLNIKTPTPCTASEQLGNELLVFATPPSITIATLTENHNEELYIP